MRLPLLTRGLGRAYLAFCSPSERNFILQILARSSDPEDAGARDKAATLAMLGRIRKLGFADRAMGVEPTSSSTLAVPIKRGKDVLATIGVTYFRSAMATKQARERYVPALWEMADNIANSVAALEQQSRRRTVRRRSGGSRTT